MFLIFSSPVCVCVCSYIYAHTNTCVFSCALCIDVCVGKGGKHKESILAFNLFPPNLFTMRYSVFLKPDICRFRNEISVILVMPTNNKFALPFCIINSLLGVHGTQNAAKK